MHPGAQWLAMVQPAQPMRTSLNGRMLFISAVSSFHLGIRSARRGQENAREVGIVLMGAELILDILLLDVEYLSAILSRNPELAVLHLDARTDGASWLRARQIRRAAAALLHIFELVLPKLVQVFVQIQRRPSLCPPALMPSSRISQALMTWSAIPELRWARVDDINSVHSSAASLSRSDGSRISRSSARNGQLSFPRR